MSNNPYSAPLANSSADSTAPEFAKRSLLSIALTVFLAWEKLRIGFIFILAVGVLAPELLADRP